MRSPVDDQAVVVLDLRDDAGAGRYSPDLDGRVLVIDDATALLEHGDVYLMLVEERQAVICLAVGQMDDPEDGVVLRHPAALTHGGGVLLWAGDTHGSRWSPAEDRTRSVPATQPSSLDQLISALRVTEVFDRVIELLKGLPYSAASPGFRLATGIVDTAELAEAGREAVRLLTDAPVGASSSSSGDPGPTMQLRIGGTEQLGQTGQASQTGQTGQASQIGQAVAAVPGSELDRSRADAVTQLAEADRTSTSLGTWRGLVGSDLPGRMIGRRFAQAGWSAERYRSLLEVLFSRMDGNLLSGNPPTDAVTAVGVDAPAAVRRRDVVAELRSYVHGQLVHERSLATLVPALRQQAAAAEPQGCAGVLHRLAELGPLQRPLPPFPPWPLPLAWLPLVLLTCAVGTLAAGETWTRWLVGLGLTIAWFLAGWVMLARRPEEHGESGFPASAPLAALAYGLPGVVGLITGLIGASLTTVPAPADQILIVASVLVLVITVALGWKRATRRWQEALDLPRLRAQIEQMSRLLVDTLTVQWVPSERRQAVAEALREVAAGLDEIARTLPISCAELFARPERADPADLPADLSTIDLSAIDLSAEVRRPVPSEVIDVVITDLVELVRAALEPGWQAIESNAQVDPDRYARRMHALVDDYRNHVARNGLLVPPAFVTDTQPRDVLAARVWTDSAEALAVLESRADDEMTQLCRGKQLNHISASARDGGMLRFAPHQLKQVREFGGSTRSAPMSREIVWTSTGDLAGALRLLPLRLGAVRSVFGGDPEPHNMGNTRP